MRVYMLVTDTTDNEYWYGYWEGDVSYWSDWCNSIEEAISKELEFDVANDPIEEVEDSQEIMILYKDTKPFVLENHPELLI